MRKHRHRSGVALDRGIVIAVVGCVGLTASLLALAFSLGPSSQTTDPLFEELQVPALLDGVSFEDSALSAVEGARPETPQPPNYRYSVVAGGVHSAADVVNAVRRDPVVRAHYAGVSLSDVRVTQAPARWEAYMSYRIGDRVYWTSKKIALAEGEAVVTDGVTTIRARCGNLIADEAMAPTSADEPPISAFEAIEPAPAVAGFSENRVPVDSPALSGAGVPGPAMSALISGPFGPSGTSGTGGPLLAPGAGPGGIVAPGGGQTSRSPSSDDHGIDETSDQPDSSAGGPGGDIQPPDFVNPFDDPPGFNPPGFGEDPGPGGGPENPGPDFPPVAPDKPTVDLRTPPEVVPVPEPGTFVLLGSGLALAAWRARRKQSRHKSSE
jgi:hypothetical protein